MVADAYSCQFSPASITGTLQHATHAGCQNFAQPGLAVHQRLLLAHLRTDLEGCQARVAMIAWRKPHFPYPPLP